MLKFIVRERCGTIAFCLCFLSIPAFSRAFDDDIRISDADLHFGSMQVKQLVLDRKDLTKALDQFPSVRKWLELSFAGRGAARRIHWDNAPTMTGREGEYTPGSDSSPTSIRISDRSDLRGFDRLAVLVFEVYNVESGSIVVDAYRRAVAGDLDRDGFVTKCVEAEFLAVAKCKKFLVEHQIPTKGNPYVTSSINVAANLEEFVNHMKRTRGLDYFYWTYDATTAAVKTK